MIFGYETYRDTTSVITTTQRGRGMVFVEYMTIQPGFSGSKSYPDVASTGLVYQQNVKGSHLFSIDLDGSGSPRLNWAAQGYTAQTEPTQVAVMATRLVSSTNSYGFEVANDAGEVLVSSTFTQPQCVGYLDFNTTAISNQPIADGYTLYTHMTTGTALQGLSSRRFLVLGLPDMGAEDTWYATEMSMLQSGANMNVGLFVATKSPTYKLPRLFIYALDVVDPTPGDYGVRVWTDTQKLLYDGGAENMALADVFGIDYPANGGTVVKTPSLAQAAYIGITSPNCYWEQKSGTMLNSGFGMAKRIGNQLSFRLMRTTQRQMGSESFTATGQPTSGVFCAVVDLTYLGFLNGTGAGGGTTQNPPQVTTHPQSQNVASGSTVIFTVAATGTGPLTYKWYRNGVPISGATSATYSFTASTTQDGNVFDCLVSNGIGAVLSNPATLSVYVANNDIPVSITSYTPQDTTVQAGNVASFSVIANGTAPFTYQWYRNGSPVGSNSSGYSYVTSTGNNGDSVFCVVSNSGGLYSDQSRTATLTVTSANSAVPVSISASTPSDVSVQAGNSAGFSVNVTGTAPFSYQWYRNGSPVGSNSSSYSYATSTANNGDTVYCVVTNNGGANSAVSRTASVSVTSMPYPVITMHPSDVTANPGQVVFMRCEASPATRFAWYRNGAYVTDGQSIQLNTSAIGDYYYYCKVYNNSLETDSNPATLSVVAPTPTTFMSYNDFSFDVDIVDNDYSFAIFTNGSTSHSGHPWANGTGDGSLYRVSASTSGFTPGPGSDPTNTLVTLSASWVMPKPTNPAPGVSVTHSLYVTVYLNGGYVCSGTITAVLRNSGTLET
jgi:hypothetical protein